LGNPCRWGYRDRGLKVRDDRDEDVRSGARGREGFAAEMWINLEILEMVEVGVGREMAGLTFS